MFLLKLVNTKVVYLRKCFILHSIPYMLRSENLIKEKENYMEVTLHLETFTVKAGIFLRSYRLRDNN